MKTSRKSKSSAKSLEPERKGTARRVATQHHVAGVNITHPERVVYPDANVTKLMVAEYYARVADRLLPFVAGRPLSIVRCPNGLNAECFFQKHLGGFKIPGIDVAMIEESTGRNPYIVANSVEALVGLAQMNALELHTWGATAAATERPDMLVLDLDPDPSLPWERLADAAHGARSLLESFDIVSFVKTTGGKGLHVVVPLQRRHAWPEIREFARDIAMHFERTSPERFTATSGEKNRRGKIFVDYLRNARGATAVTPYSLRARPGARVATPLDWDEVSPKRPPGSFTIETVPRRIARQNDPWASYGEHRQRLSAKTLRALRSR